MSVITSLESGISEPKGAPRHRCLRCDTDMDMGMPATAAGAVSRCCDSADGSMVFDLVDVVEDALRSLG